MFKIKITIKNRKGVKDRSISGFFILVFFSLFLVFYFSSGLRAEMDSASYTIEADVIGSFGNESDSANYSLGDTGGEMATEDMTSASYYLRSGFWPVVMDYHISLSCDVTVNMGQISGTGQSDLTTNDATCTVRTDNPTGYNLTFVSDTASMLNANNDTIAPYSPVSSGIPEAWSVDSSTSEWGARLKSTSTTYDDSKWGAAAGTEDYSAVDVYWHNVTDSSSFTIVSKNSETPETGETEILQFGAEVGADKIQPTGIYDVDVTVTAVTL